jgi:hypothetical protein
MTTQVSIEKNSCQPPRALLKSPWHQLHTQHHHHKFISRLKWKNPSLHIESDIDTRLQEYLKFPFHIPFTSLFLRQIQFTSLFFKAHSIHFFACYMILSLRQNISFLWVANSPLKSEKQTVKPNASVIWFKSMLDK